MDKHETMHQPKYDRETFELMVDDYLFDHYTDDSVDGKITIDRDTIEYDEDNKHWHVNVKFDDDEHWYSVAGYDDGNCELFY